MRQWFVKSRQKERGKKLQKMRSQIPIEPLKKGELANTARYKTGHCFSSSWYTMEYNSLSSHPC